MIDRIFKNWKTTVIGLAIIVMSGGAVYLDKASLTESSAFIVTGITLFFVKDKKST